MFQLSRDLARDLRRGFVRGLLLAAFPLIAILGESRTPEAIWASLSLLTLVAAAMAVTGFEGQARRRPENSRFWYYLGILIVSGLTPFALFLQAQYLVTLAVSDASQAIEHVGKLFTRALREPLVLFFSALFSGAVPTLLSVSRIREDSYAVLADLKRAALVSLPLILSPLVYIALLVWVGALSLVLTLADWIEGLLFKDRVEGKEHLAGRLARGEISRRDLQLAAILGDPAALAIRGERREERGLVELVEELQFGGPATLARAAHALAGLVVPLAADPEEARRAHELAGQAIRHLDASLVEEELERWPWRRELPASQRAIHSLLEAARAVGSDWAATTCFRSAKECAQAALQLSTPEGARAAVTSALLPWVLEEYDPLPQRPEAPAPTSEVSAEDESGGDPSPAEPPLEASESG